MKLFLGDNEIKAGVKVVGVPAQPKTDSEVHEILNNYVEYISEKQTNERVFVPYLDTPVTLYTPSAQYTKYVIRQRTDNDKWNIFWIKSTESKVIALSSSIGTGRLGGLVYDFTISRTTYSGQMSLYLFTGVYFSAQYDTLEECIAAASNPATIYTQKIDASINNKLGNNTYTNGTLFNNLSDSTQIVVANQNVISLNETIEVIP